MLANGQAPKQLRPFIGGANGFAFLKESKPDVNGVVHEDARPVCSGDVWRRVVGKALFSSEEDTFKEHLHPHQLALAVRAGAEVTAHSARTLMEQHREYPTRILIDSDEGNAHNEVDRHTFLLRAREVAPGICRWIEYIYPTECPTMVFYHGTIIDSEAGGQQGCPLIAVCHAMVQRILLEVAGLIPIASSTTPVGDVMAPPANLDMCPMFADDCIIAGVAGEVARTLTHWKAIMPSLGLRFSRLEAIPAAGHRHSFDMSVFDALGCTSNFTQTAIVMKSPIGPKEFCERIVGNRVDDSVKVLDAIAQLPKSHIALYLLRYQIGRMDYIKRCTPAASCADSFRMFDNRVQCAVEHILGRELTSSQWEQTAAPLRHSGLGFRSVVETAGEAYLASLLGTRKLRQVLGAPDIASTNQALEQVNARLPAGIACFTEPDDIDDNISQQLIGRRLAEAKAIGSLEEGTIVTRARLHAYAAPGAAKWTDAPPSKTLDMYLTNWELLTVVSLQLGVDVFEEDSVCQFCGMVLDMGGIHAMSCTAGGDMQCRHNQIRDIIYRFCVRARLNPQLEKPGLLDDESIIVNLRRPADVLAEMRPGSATPMRTAIDVKVINALGQGHFNETGGGGLVAAENYRESQREHLNTADLCASRGIAYEPMVFTTQGGIERHGEALVAKIAAAIAANEEASASEVKTAMQQEISVSLMRSAAKAIGRRRRQRGAQARNTAADRRRQEATHLEVEDFTLQ